MCEQAVMSDGCEIRFVPKKFLTKELCAKAIENDKWAEKYVPDEFKL